MSTIYQKIKGAEKLRKSFVSLESKDGTVSPTKINSTLVEGSKGMGKKFVNHSNALMDGYETTLNEDGASYGDSIKSDGKGDTPFDGFKKFLPITKYKSVAKNDPEAEAKKALGGSKTTKTKREGDFMNEGGDALDVTDVVTLTPGETKVEDYSKEWDKEAAGGLDYAEWIKQPGNQEKEDKFVASKTTTTPDKEDKSVEMKTSEEDTEVKTPGGKKSYNMGWMESRNASRALETQAKSAKKVTKRNQNLIKKFEKGGGNSESESMSPELRAAYAHFQAPTDKKSKFETKIGSTSGRDTKGTSETKTANVKGKDGAIKLGPDGKPIVKEPVQTVNAYKSAAKSLISPTKFKLKGSTYKKQ